MDIESLMSQTDVVPVSYELDAHSFGEYIRHGGSWGYAAIVARWVEPGAGQGLRLPKELTEVSKVSAEQFARDAAVSRPTVTKYLKTWELAATDGHVPSSASLQPGEQVGLDEEELPEWGSYYKRANSKPDSEDGDREDRNLPPLPSAAKNKFFKTFSGVSKITQYEPSTVVSLLGDDPDDYLHLEQQVMILAKWLNEVNDCRKSAQGKEKS